MSNGYTQPQTQSNTTYLTHPSKYHLQYYPHPAVYPGGPTPGRQPSGPEIPNDAPPYKHHPLNVSQQHPPTYSPQFLPPTPPISPPIGPIPQHYNAQFTAQPQSNTPFPPSSPPITEQVPYYQYRPYPLANQTQNFSPYQFQQPTSPVPLNRSFPNASNNDSREIPRNRAGAVSQTPPQQSAPSFLSQPQSPRPDIPQSECVSAGTLSGSTPQPPTQYPFRQTWPIYSTGPPTTPQFSAPNTMNCTPQNAHSSFPLQTPHVQYQTNSSGTSPNATINYSETRPRPFPSPSSGTFNPGSPNPQNGPGTAPPYFVPSPPSSYSDMSRDPSTPSQDANQNSNIGPHRPNHYVVPQQDWSQRHSISFNQAPKETGTQICPQSQPSMLYGTQDIPIPHDGPNQIISRRGRRQPQSKISASANIEARESDRSSSEKLVVESSCYSPSQFQSLDNSHEAKPPRTEQGEQPDFPSGPVVLSEVLYDPAQSPSQDDYSSLREQRSPSESEISSTMEISSRSMTSRVRKSSSLDTDVKPHKKNKVVNKEPGIGDTNEESQELLVSVQPESPQVENSLAEISRFTSEVQDIPSSPASQKLSRHEGRGESGSTPAENLSPEGTPVDTIFIKKVPTQSPEPDVTTIAPLLRGLKTNNANNDNIEESDSIYNSISPIEHVATQIPTFHLSKTEEDDSKILPRASPLAPEMPDLEQPNSNLRVEWGQPNQSAESENDIQPEEAEWDSIRLRYPGVCEEKNKLGEGISGRVFKDSALKILYDTEPHRKEVLTVRKICNLETKQLNPHIIRVEKTMLVRCGNKPSKLLIQMELCDGTLTNYLKEIRRRQDHIKEREIQSILVQILAGLCYCHSEGIVHRDLKPNNVLYTNKKCDCHSKDSECRLLLSDFGFSKPITNGISSGRGGSIGYRAHELLKSNEYSDKTDVWAFGCIIMDVATTGRQRAFRGDDEASSYGKGESPLPKLRSGDNPELDDSVLDHLNYLIELCLEKEPKDRPTAAKLLESIREKWGRFGWVTV